MPRIPKISGNQMIRYPQRKGFVITRRKSSHLTLRRESIFTIVPAGNKMPSIRTQRDILSDAGITRDEFSSNYENGLIKQSTIGADLEAGWPQRRSVIRP